LAEWFGVCSFGGRHIDCNHDLLALAVCSSLPAVSGAMQIDRAKVDIRQGLRRRGAKWWTIAGRLTDKSHQTPSAGNRKQQSQTTCQLTFGVFSGNCDQIKRFVFVQIKT
jgi:hypothetical protein